MNDEGVACPPLFGPRVTLEPLTAAHAAALFPLFSDEVLWQYEDERAPRTVDALERRYRMWEARRSPDGVDHWLNWAVRVPEHGFIGAVQATVYDNAQAWIAYMLGRRFWSCGYGTEAARLAVTHVRGTLDVARAFAIVDERNDPSQRLLRRLGFRLVDGEDPRNLLFALEDAPRPSGAPPAPNSALR